MTLACPLCNRRPYSSSIVLDSHLRDDHHSARCPCGTTESWYEHIYESHKHDMAAHLVEVENTLRLVGEEIPWKKR